jgi:5'-3' exonuclease
MKFNLIIDGNYILNKNVFALHRINELYGSLELSMHNSLKSFTSWYGFTNVYLVSDSGESWRKKLYTDYKASRSKNDAIDWDFVFEAYNNFKSDLPARVKLLERKYIEGDDWISYLVNNNKDVCTLIVSNDHDLKQLIKFTTTPQSMVFMTNEMYNNGKLFLPNNYEIFLNHVRSTMSDNIFELTDETEFLNFMNKFITKREVVLVNRIEEYVVKLIQGDKSDNIKSAYTSISSNGRPRGIGQAGAKKIYDSYLKEFGDVKLDDEELFDNIADLICESKNISYSNLPKIKDNLELNKKLINLMTLPDKVTKIIEDEIEKLNSK